MNINKLNKYIDKKVKKIINEYFIDFANEFRHMFDDIQFIDGKDKDVYVKFKDNTKILIAGNIMNGRITNDRKKILDEFAHTQGIMNYTIGF